MNFDAALDAHHQWKVRLRMFVNGASKEHLDPVAIAKDNQCELGKWLYGAAAVHKSRPNYAALKAAHAEFHSLAGQIVKLAVAGDKGGAQHALDGPYVQSSSKVMQAIRKLKEEVPSA